MLYGGSGSCSADGVVHPVKGKVLRLASRRLGGTRQLRDRLKVPTEQLLRWMAGTEEPPDEAVLEALAIILDELDARDR